MDSITLRATIAQASLLRRIGLTHSCKFDADIKMYVVELRGPGGVLISVGSSPIMKDVLDIALDGYVSIYGEALPDPMPAAPAPAPAPEEVPAAVQ